MSKTIAVFAMALAILTSGHPAEAQQTGKVPRIGYLSAASRSALTARTEAFRQGLRDLGYVERKNIVIEYRYAEGKLDRLSGLAAELVRLKMDVIVATGTTPLLLHCKRPRRSPSSRLLVAILLGPDSSPALRGPVGVSQG